MKIEAYAKTMPKVIHIGHLPYTVAFADGWITVGEGDDGRKWGTCDHGKATILITDPKEMPSSEMLASVFLHELFHALWYQAGLPTKAKEEDVVAGFEFAMMSFMKANPKAMDWIRKGLT